MTKGVINYFETIKVQVKNAAFMLFTFRQSLRLTQTVCEEKSIRQTGQLVVMCHEIELLLGFLTCRDISTNNPDGPCLVILEAAGNRTFNINSISTLGH